ncbi:mechanosensitive ion channel [Halocatena pleomorpha]|nr:mechanosensitive ion channel [Halocatena pleomorpha]
MFQLRDRNVLGDILSQIISYIPQLIAALIVLLVGWIVGRLLGRIVTTVLKKADVERFVPGGDGDGRDGTDGGGVGLARGLGKLVKYYVYFIAVLAAAEILAIPMLTELLSDVGAYLPVILAAVVILLVGFIIGRVLEDIIADLIGGLGFDMHLTGTPLERLTERRGIGGLIGQLVALYVYFIALVAAADTLNISVLSNLLNTITVYIPQLIGGAAVLLVGIWIGDWLGTQVAETDHSKLTDYVGIGVKVIVYYLVITMALQTAGFNASILNTLFVIAMAALFGSLAIAFIIAAGVGGALGSKDYIADNIADWMRNARQSMSFEDEGSDTSGESGFEPPSD